MDVHNTRHTAAQAVLACLAALLFVLPAHAQKVDERMREQLRSTITQMRALADENASLKAQLATVSAKPVEDPARLGKLQKDLARLRAELDQAKAALLAMQEKSSAQKTAFDTQKTSAEAEQRDKLKALQQVLAAEREAQGKTTALEQCTAANASLVTISSELIERYRDRGVVDALISREPITGLRGAQLERLAQTYQIRVGEQTVRENTVAAPAADASEQGKQP
ncbi:MAG: hypothetical protein ACT4PZ_10085 [Panacagrimonas sp.]